MSMFPFPAATPPSWNGAQKPEKPMSHQDHRNRAFTESNREEKKRVPPEAGSRLLRPLSFEDLEREGWESYTRVRRGRRNVNRRASTHADGDLSLERENERRV